MPIQESGQAIGNDKPLRCKRVRMFAACFGKELGKKIPQRNLGMGEVRSAQIVGIMKTPFDFRRGMNALNRLRRRDAPKIVNQGAVPFACKRDNRPVIHQSLEHGRFPQRTDFILEPRRSHIVPDRNFLHHSRLISVSGFVTNYQGMGRAGTDCESVGIAVFRSNYRLSINFLTRMLNGVIVYR